MILQMIKTVLLNLSILLSLCILSKRKSFKRINMLYKQTLWIRKRRRRRRRRKRGSNVRNTYCYMKFNLLNFILLSKLILIFWGKDFLFLFHTNLRKVMERFSLKLSTLEDLINWILLIITIKRKELFFFPAWNNIRLLLCPIFGESTYLIQKNLFLKLMLAFFNFIILCEFNIKFHLFKNFSISPIFFFFPFFNGNFLYLT